MANPFFSSNNLAFESFHLAHTNARAWLRLRAGRHHHVTSPAFLYTNFQSSKFLGYATLAPPLNDLVVTKFLGFATLAPPLNDLVVVKLLGYAVLQPAPFRRWVQDWPNPTTLRRTNANRGWLYSAPPGSIPPAPVADIPFGPMYAMPPGRVRRDYSGWTQPSIATPDSPLIAAMYALPPARRRQDYAGWAQAATSFVVMQPPVGRGWSDPPMRKRAQGQQVATFRRGGTLTPSSWKARVIMF